MFESKLKKQAAIFIDALSFSQEKKSGIGHISEEITLSLARQIENTHANRVIYLVVPLGKSKYVKKYANRIIKIKTLPLPARVFHLLNNLNLLPPLDIFLGKGIYIFPNYRNWKLLFSTSFTYLHDLAYLHYEAFVEPKNLRYLQKNIPIWIKRADIIITGSQYTKREIIKYLKVNTDKVKVVPHGVNTEDFFRVNKDRRDKVLKSYGIGSDGYILHVGNIEPRKNITGLISAYRALPTNITSKHPLLLIGGGGWLNNEEEDAINAALASGLMILKPNRYVEDSDLASFYSSASCLAMPSHYEGFGVPPLQAMACGVPIVVADNSSLHEIFGTCAYLVDANDIQNISNGILAALSMTSDEAKAYNTKANRVVNSHSWQVTAERILKLVDEVDGI